MRGYFTEGVTLFLRTTLASTLALAIASTPVHAQSAADTSATETLDEIVVTGFSGSLSRALTEKRDANNVVDVINAEDIGKFPAQNIAEALQRVPGVSIVRDRGEGVFVRVRGLGSHFQVVTLNNRTVAVNENVRDSGQQGRQFRFDTLPSELMAGVEIIKSPNAALDEGGIAGTVNLRTFRPIDLKQPVVSMSATASYPELADKIDPRLSGMASWVNDDATFGALLAAVYDERTLRQDRLTGVGWTEGQVDTDGNGTRESGRILVPQSTRPTLEREDRNRIGLNGAIQWRPSERFELNVDAMWSQLNVHYDELTYSTDFQNTTARALVPGTAKIVDGVLVAGTVNTSTQIGRETSHLRYSNWLLGANARYKGEDWILTADASYGEAKSSTPDPIYRSRLLGPVGRVSFDYGKTGDRLPNISFLDADLNQPSTLPGRRLEYRVNSSVDTERAGKLDFEHGLGDGPFSKVKVGAKYQKRDRDYDRRDINFTRGIAGQRFPAGAFSPFPEKDFLDGVDGNLPKTWLMPRPDSFIDAAQDMDSLLSQPLTRGDKRNSYEISEEITAAYAMTDFGFDLGSILVRGDLGLRFARTKQTSSGHADNGTVAIPVSFERTYNNWLPALNLAAEITPDFQARLAVSKVITRPSLADLAPRLTVNSNPTILEAVGGNPELKPFEAWQYDATAEWYFGQGSALIAGLFYKDITTFVFQQKSNLLIDGRNYTLTAPVNGGNAYVAGVEIAYQHLFKSLPAPWDGLGFLASYTHTKSKGTYADAGGATFKDDLVDVAKDSFNVTAFYEKNAIGVRLSYSWRGDVLRDVGGAGLEANNDKAFGSLDADMSYKLNDNVTFVLQGMNMLGAVQWQYVRDDHFAGYTDYGRTLMAGVRAKF